MIRKIIHIDQENCNGCGLCIEACHESAIGMVDGKATLLRDDYCDGLGDCLPVCPTGAISFEEREAPAYNLAEVKKNLEKAGTLSPGDGCPGTAVKAIHRADDCAASNVGCPGSHAQAFTAASLAIEAPLHETAGQLSQWPVQIKLAPINAPYFHGSNLLIAADCTAFAYGAFHERFIKNHITLIGCPKLDAVDYTDKLSAILQHNDIKSLKVVRMNVPCCGGIAHAATQALQNSGKMIPWQIVTISTDGKILDE